MHFSLSFLSPRIVVFIFIQVVAGIKNSFFLLLSTIILNGHIRV